MPIRKSRLICSFVNCAVPYTCTGNTNFVVLPVWVRGHHIEFEKRAARFKVLLSPCLMCNAARTPSRFIMLQRSDDFICTLCRRIVFAFSLFNGIVTFGVKVIQPAPCISLLYTLAYWFAQRQKGHSTISNEAKGRYNGPRIYHAGIYLSFSHSHYYIPHNFTIYINCNASNQYSVATSHKLISKKDTKLVIPQYIVAPNTHTHTSIQRSNLMSNLTASALPYIHIALRFEIPVVLNRY